jgi:hypothetical protein
MPVKWLSSGISRSSDIRELWNIGRGNSHSEVFIVLINLFRRILGHYCETHHDGFVPRPFCFTVQLNLQQQNPIIRPLKSIKGHDLQPDPSNPHSDITTPPTLVAEGRGVAVRVPALYSGGPWFESRSTDRLF